jgi:hypothetical protein
MTEVAPVPVEEQEDDDERYSFRCGCGASVSPGQALRGGKVVCTCCGENVPLPGAGP